MTPDLLSQGLNLMLYGMGTVIVFLTLLVGAISLLTMVVSNMFPEPEKVVSQRRPKLAVPDRHLRAIQEALDQHRNRTK